MTIEDWFAGLEKMAQLVRTQPPENPDILSDLDHWLFLNQMLAADLDGDDAPRAAAILADISKHRDMALHSAAMLTVCRRHVRRQHGIDTTDTTVEAFAMIMPWGGLRNQPVLETLAELHLYAGRITGERFVLVAPRWVRETFTRAATFGAVEHTETIDTSRAGGGESSSDLARIEIAATLWLNARGGPHQHFSQALAAADALMC